MLTTYNFQGYRGFAESVFDCPSCQKKNRKRTFRTEMTVNPFNKNVDGTTKQAMQVQREASAAAREARDQFNTEPLCKTCEDALSYPDRRALRERRSAALAKAEAK